MKKGDYNKLVKEYNSITSGPRRKYLRSKAAQSDYYKKDDFPLYRNQFDGFQYKDLKNLFSSLKSRDAKTISKRAYIKVHAKKTFPDKFKEDDFPPFKQINVTVERYSRKGFNELYEEYKHEQDSEIKRKLKMSLIKSFPKKSSKLFKFRNTKYTRMSYSELVELFHNTKNFTKYKLKNVAKRRDGYKPKDFKTKDRESWLFVK